LEVGLPPRTGRPKYLEIADDLRAKIANGTYPIDGELPSTARLMELYDVSTTVVRAAVRELRTEGLVVGQPGKAVYVQAEPQPAEPSPEYSKVMGQLKAVRRALADLDARMSRLEAAAPGQTKPAERTRRAGGRARQG
jgi:DNA-binding GntR family transcriptional regulator